MICAMTARKIKPGQTEQFLEAFINRSDEGLPAEIRERFTAVCACRSTEDPETILTFGMFDGSIDEMRELQSGSMRREQLAEIEPFVEQTLFDGSFELLHDLVAEAGGGRSPFTRFAPTAD